MHFMSVNHKWHKKGWYGNVNTSQQSWQDKKIKLQALC